MQVTQVAFGDEAFPFKLQHDKFVNQGGPPHYHAETEIIIIHKGEGFCFINNCSYPLKKNTVFLIHPHEVHNLVLPDPETVEKTVLLFDLSIFPKAQFAEETSFFSGCSPKFKHQVCFEGNSAYGLQIIINGMVVEWEEKGPLWEDSVLLGLLQLAVVLVRASAGSKVPASESDACPLVINAIDYINKHFSEKLTLRCVAEAVSCSPYHLSHLIKKYTGITFKDYLTNYRISHARMMLENTDLKVTSIAGKTGFPNLQNFNRSFKLLTGITASTYRRACKRISG